MSTIVSQSRNQHGSMKPCLQSNPTTVLEQFLSTLFLPYELIELRFIESWTSHGKKSSRVARTAEWLRPGEFVARHREVIDFAKQERANVYFGVCPRPKRGDSRDDQIQTVRCLWCDMDNVTADKAVAQWEKARVPQPSIVVSSGGGIHGYWLLDRDTRSAKGRALITALLPQFYRSFGGDHVQNLSRILRSPGTFNYKDVRNGRPPQRCTLLTCQPEVRYPVDAFSRWIKQKQRQQRTRPVSAQHATQVSAEDFLARNVEVAALVRQLDKPTRDRSRRDFAIVCDLLRLGLTADEIWPLVAGSSKFDSNGRPYFDVTIANAERRVLLDPPATG